MIDSQFRVVIESTTMSFTMEFDMFVLWLYTQEKQREEEAPRTSPTLTMVRAF